MRKKYYKVVDAGSLASARAFDFGSIKYEVYYKLNQWVTAHNDSRLFVFDNLEQAFEFKNNGEDVYECEITGGINFYGCVNRANMYSFWQVFNKLLKRKKKIKKEHFSKYHIGTHEIPAVLAKKVKLTKLITK